MKHKVLKILIVSIVIAITIASFLFYAMYVSPENITITHKNIASKKIPASLDDVNVAYISDIHYGEFMDEKRLTSMFKKVNRASPDIILFGGDLFSHPEAYLQNAEEVKKITDMLEQLEAPLGKYYVLGEDDLVNEEAMALVHSIFYNAGYENLTNRNIKIHNNEIESITLIGLDSLIGGNPNIQEAYANVSNESFNIVFTHTPDILIDIPKENTDLAFAGHSHGGQISFPLYGPLSSTDGAKKYETGIYNYDTHTIVISNGLGTTNVDMRLFSPPEVIIYRLQNK